MFDSTLFLTINRVLMIKWVLISLFCVALAGCAVAEFKPRGPVTLPDRYTQIYIEGLEPESDLTTYFKAALRQRGSYVVKNKSSSSSVLHIAQLHEKKRVAGYGANREVRQYLIQLKFLYKIVPSDINDTSTIPWNTIDLDKTQSYDSEFILGKIDEEEIIRKSLRKDAVRRVMLQMQYAVN